MIKPSVDYRKLRWHNLNSAEFCHLKLLLFWPAFGLLFALAERGNVLHRFYSVHCALDSLIPFCEYFLIPYFFWFVYLIGMLGYLLLYDVGTFRKFMKFIILTYSVTIVIYFLFPTVQHLRPTVFPRHNFLTSAVQGLYLFDTDTDVCPSIHVVGTLAVLFASWQVPRFRRPGWRAAFWVAAVLICVSTVFIKQHSVLDLLAALPLCLVGYWFAYRRRKPFSARRPGAF